MQIYDHDSPEAINYKNSAIELEDWLEQLNYIEREISNLLNLVKSGSEDLEVKKYLEILEKKRETNSNILRNLMEYRNTLPKAAECEDVECDMFYINEHMKYRKMYRDHMENYRNVKEDFFKILTK